MAIKEVNKKRMHDITVPYVVRFTWASGEAQREWEDRMFEARLFLLYTLPTLLVDKGFAPFAPIAGAGANMTHKVADAVVANHYFCRWTTFDRNKDGNPHIQPVGVYGENIPSDFNPAERWDLLRDLWQLALADDCCKKAYFETKERDPYMELYKGVPAAELGDNKITAAKNIKWFENGLMNPLTAPLGLFVSPIVPCSPTCSHASKKANEIFALIEEANQQVAETLRMVVEQPIRHDNYRGLVEVKTPMFIGVYSSEPYVEKHILDAKAENPKAFHYNHDWVAKGVNFPFKGPFSSL